MIDPALREVLVGRLRERELQLAHTAAKRSAIGSRKEDIEISRNGRMQLHRTGGEDAAPRVVIRDSRQTCDPKPLDQPLVGDEEKRLVAAQRASEDAAELVARERRNRFVLRIEVALTIHRRGPPECEQRSMQDGAAGPGTGIADDSLALC